MREYIEWRPAMEMGLQPLDDEHRRLVAVINRLYEMWAANSKSQVLGISLDELKDYALGHFKNEEKMMAEAGYPELGKHRGQHAAFVIRLQEIEACIESDICKSSQLLTYLSDWLTHHILASDQHFARFMKQKV